MKLNRVDTFLVLLATALTIGAVVASDRAEATSPLAVTASSAIAATTTLAQNGFEASFGKSKGIVSAPARTGDFRQPIYFVNSYNGPTWYLGDSYLIGVDRNAATKAALGSKSMSTKWVRTPSVSNLSSWVGDGAPIDEKVAPHALASLVTFSDAPVPTVTGLTFTGTMAGTSWPDSANSIMVVPDESTATVSMHVVNGLINTITFNEPKFSHSVTFTYTALGRTTKALPRASEIVSIDALYTKVLQLSGVRTLADKLVKSRTPQAIERAITTMSKNPAVTQLDISFGRTNKGYVVFGQPLVYRTSDYTGYETVALAGSWCIDTTGRSAVTRACTLADKAVALKEYKTWVSYIQMAVTSESPSRADRYMTLTNMSDNMFLFDRGAALRPASVVERGAFGWAMYVEMYPWLGRGN